MAIVRWFIGRIILILDRLTSPRAIERDAKSQMQVDQETETLALYQLEACPFCVKVRRTMKRLNLRIELRDIKRSEKFASELLQHGGQDQVPCLRIPGAAGKDQWLYESDAIIEYLEKHFALQEA